MAAEDELELSEREMFDIDSRPVSSVDTLKEEQAEGRTGTPSSSDDESSSKAKQEPARRVPGPPKPMISRKIRRSLDASEARHIRTSSRGHEEDEDEDADIDLGLSWIARSNAQQGKHVFGVQSLPVSHAKLGTSAPINIPMQGRRKKTDAPSKGAHQPAAGQSPSALRPHEMTHQEVDGQGRTSQSFAGQLGAASVKRSRLQQRNAILRSTGFLEEKHKGAGLGTITERDSQDAQKRPNGLLHGIFGGSPTSTTPTPGHLATSLHQVAEPAPLA